MSKENPSLLAVELITKAKKEGRASSWDNLNNHGGCKEGVNPYKGIEELSSAWDEGYAEAENDFYFEQDNPDMFYDEDEEYYQDYVEREW